MLLQMPNDCRVWMEQGMDPGHANFLHHGEREGFVHASACVGWHAVFKGHAGCNLASSSQLCTAVRRGAC